MKGLMLHCGAEPINRNELFSLSAPKGMTDTHYPIAHRDLIELVEQGFNRFGKYEITNQEFGISHDQNRMFGIMGLRGTTAKSNWETIMAYRNSHDQAFSAGMAGGSHVFCCDNLAFMGEVVFGRKHTKNILNELPQKIDECLWQLSDKMDLLAGRYDHYENTPMGNAEFHDIACRALDINRDGRQYVIKGNRVSKVLDEWYNPRHEEFEPRNAWSAFNCFTEVTKGIQLNEQSKRTQSLHQLFDQATGALEALSQEPELVN